MNKDYEALEGELKQLYNEVKLFWISSLIDKTKD